MHRICNSLANNGFDITLIGRKLKDSGAFESPNYHHIRLNCRFNKGKLFYLEYNIRLLFLLIKNRYTINCAIDTDTLLANTLCSSSTGSYLVYDAHELFTEVPEVTHRKITKLIWTMVEKICIPNVHLAYTVGQSIASILSTAHNIEFKVIKNVPTQKTEHSKEGISKETELTIIYQGALNKGRGLEWAIEAIKDLDIKLWVVGDGDIKHELELLVNKFGVDKKVKFWGKINPSQLKEITQKAHIGYNVLENLGLSYYYSLSNKFFDYAHACIPSLSSNFPEYSFLLQEHRVGFLVEPNIKSVRLFFEKISQNPDILRLNMKVFNEATTYWSWEVEETKLLKLYNEL
jgi:glycosyltransferase involved in cell wall biosynthesis